MLDLNQIVMDSMKSITEEKLVETMVKAQLEATIKEVIKDVFKDWSPFGKQLKKEIEEGMKIDFDKLELASYNDLVLTYIKEEIEKSIHSEGLTSIKEQVTNLLSDHKDVYTITEIIDTIRDEYKDEDEKITLIIEDEGRFVHVYLDSESDKKRWDCEYRFGVSLETKKEEDKIYRNESNFENTGKVYTMQINDSKISSVDMVNGMNGIKEIFYKIHLTGAKVKFDNGTDVDDYYVYHRDEDEREEY